MKSIRHLYKIGNGPSSSHTMGPQKCCNIIKEKYPNANFFNVYLYGSLALTGKGHLTDFIIEKTLVNCNVKFDYITNYDHPNTMKIEALFNDVYLGELTFVSVGGGDVVIKGESLKEELDIYPVTTLDDTKQYLKDNNLSLLNYIIKYEGEDIINYIKEIKKVMLKSIEVGLTKTDVLPGKLKVERKGKKIFDKATTMQEKILAYAYAVNEENASAGLIVTAPTCGASGVIPALLRGLSEEFKYSEQKLIEALLIAGFFGCLIKENASISGAEAGCQAEVGSACSMASALTTYLFDCNIDVIEQAAEMALEHNLGLTCDPVLGYVQIPCIERNAVAANQAYDCAILSKILQEGTNKITFDIACRTMLETGKDLSEHYRETSIGGLAKHYEKK
ncbi:MAG: L-serine ammonia-lyase, iron-sulfur-dependent, subunit alpha [bacterium]